MYEYLQICSAIDFYRWILFIYKFSFKLFGDSSFQFFLASNYFLELLRFPWKFIFFCHSLHGKWCMTRRQNSGQTQRPHHQRELKVKQNLVTKNIPYNYKNRKKKRHAEDDSAATSFVRSFQDIFILVFLLKIVSGLASRVPPCRHCWKSANCHYENDTCVACIQNDALCFPPTGGSRNTKGNNRKAKVRAVSQSSRQAGKQSASEQLTAVWSSQETKDPLAFIHDNNKNSSNGNNNKEHCITKAMGNLKE